MFITPSFKKSLIVEQFQGNYLKYFYLWQHGTCSWQVTNILYNLHYVITAFQYTIFPKTLPNETEHALKEGKLCIGNLIQKFNNNDWLSYLIRINSFGGVNK